MRRSAALLLPVMLLGCSGFQPFIAGPPALQPWETDPGNRVSVCYNTLKTPPEKLQEMAQAECPKGTAAESVGTDYTFENCPLMTPGRANFVCKSPR
ncbi:MAG TPA: hypothetical protein VG651_00850 [Stellaceae bacterium]|nr:hypothetical protein [Stellaceae bacterium]